MGQPDNDLRKAAFVFIKELLHLKQGEKLLIYVDQRSDYPTVEIIQESAQQMGGVTEIFTLNSNLKLPDMAQELTDKIEKGAFDIVCELSEQSIYQTLVWERALQLGSRIYSLGGMDSNAFIRCVGEVNHNLMFQFGLTLRGTLEQADALQIITKEGTNIKLRMNTNLISRFISKLKRKQGSCIWYPSGILTEDIKYSFLGGQLSFQGIAETIEGMAVIDGYLWPPKEIGRLDTPITLKIKKGRVIEIGGCPVKSKVLNRWFGQEPKELQHFCIGFNPGATLSGKLMEAERVFGCISIGIGKYPFHMDGVIKNPSVLLDDKFIEQEGSFINEELSVLERKLI